MSKAILVTNMPENCNLCGFCQEINGSYYCCGCRGAWYEHQLEDEEMSTKPTWCPLKPMPQKIEILDSRMKTAIGWNDCIDEMLGK